jgi:hypothetical protein
MNSSGVTGTQILILELERVMVNLISTISSQILPDTFNVEDILRESLCQDFACCPRINNKRVRSCNNTIETESALCSRNGSLVGLLRQAKDKLVTAESIGQFLTIDKPYRNMLNMGDGSVS